MPLVIPNPPPATPPGAPEWDDVTPLIESRALKKRLEGIKVSGSSYMDKHHDVPVIFASPDFELQKAEYPGIYITYGNIGRASDREVRGPTNLTYAPPGYALTPEILDRATSTYRVPEHPIPYNIDFNVAVMTRSQQQAFEIVTQLQGLKYLPERFGGLEVPEDGTIRTLELLGGPDVQVSTDEDSKRMVTTLYSVRVAAELNLYEIELMKKALSVNIDYQYL